MVADLHSGHRGSDLLDCPGPFVPEHDGSQPGRETGVTGHHVGVAHADTGDAHQDLVRAQRAQLDVLDVERAVVSAQYRRAGSRHRVLTDLARTSSTASSQLPRVAISRRNFMISRGSSRVAAPITRSPVR